MRKRVTYRALINIFGRGTTMNERRESMERPQNNTEDVLKNLGLFPSCQLSWELTTGAHLLIHSPQEIYIVVLSLTLTLVDIFTCGEIFVTAFENTVNLFQQKVPNCRPANKHVAIQGSRGWRGGGQHIAMLHFFVLGILKYSIGWRPQIALIENNTN